MSFARCIPADLPAAIKKRLNQAADAWERQGKSRQDAEVAAVHTYLNSLDGQKRALAMSTIAEARIRSDIAAAKSGKDAARRLESYAETSTRGVNNDKRSASAQQQIAHDVAADKMRDFRDLGARTSRADAERVSADVLRELAGTDSGNAGAKKAAKSLSDGLTWLKDEFNRLGGAIKTRGNYLLPQTWDAAKIRESGRDAFIERMAAFYEKPGAMDPLLGPHGAPLDGDELRGALAEIHDTIVTGNTRGTIGQVSGAMRNRHLDPRSISFRDVEARIEAANLFGDPNVFDVVDDHLYRMSGEIGAMGVFGPHPDLAWSNLRELAQRKGAKQSRLLVADATYQAVTGALNSPGSAGLAVAGRTFRAGISAGLLPLSLVSQLSDVVPVSLTASLHGIPAMRSVVNGLKQVAGAGLSREQLSAIGVIMDGGLAHLRNAGVIDAAGRTRRFVDANMRFYGIKRWAEMMQAAQEATMLNHLAGLRGKTLAEADEAMNGALSKLGWTEATWDAVRTHGILDVDGANFASIRALDASTLGEAAKAEAKAQLVYTARRYSNLGMTVPDAKTRGLMALGAQAGTFTGEGARTLTQFKSFGTQFFLNQVGQIAQAQTLGSAVGYGAKIIAGTTALGMVSLQVKRLLKGQDLADMDPTTPEGRAAWMGALMQGGGFGILGDFFTATTQQNRFDRGLIDTLAGPGFGFVKDVSELTLGNVGAAARGEQANFASEAGKMAGRYAPFVNAPFMGLAYQRLLVDQYRLWADPSGTRRSFMSMEQRQRDEFNSRYWWRPGRTLPEALQ